MAYGLAPELRRAAAREAYALLLLGRPEECLEVELGAYEVVHAACHWSSGREDVARDLVASAEEQFGLGRSEGAQYLPDLVAAELATFYAFIGDAASAARWATRAYESSPVGIDPRVLESELFDRVRNDAGFREQLTQAQSAAGLRVVSGWQAYPLAASAR